MTEHSKYGPGERSARSARSGGTGATRGDKNSLPWLKSNYRSKITSSRSQAYGMGSTKTADSSTVDDDVVGANVGSAGTKRGDVEMQSGHRNNDVYHNKDNFSGGGGAKTPRKSKSESEEYIVHNSPDSSAEAPQGQSAEGIVKTVNIDVR